MNGDQGQAASFKDAYVVLKNMAPRVGDPFSVPATISEASLEDRISIDTDEMTMPEVVQRSQERNVQAIAPVMPMRLIEPVASVAVNGLDPQTSASSGGATWGIEAVRATSSAFTGEGITVAVLDTGIDAGHPAFAATSITQRDFTGEGDGDNHGHGTHCAGTVCGNLGSTRIGVAPGVSRLLVGKVLGQSGGATNWIVNGILWAMEEGANVISMSLGTDFQRYRENLVARGIPTLAATSIALQGYRANVRLYDSLANTIRAQQSFRPSGCIVVAASGNESARDGNPAYEIAAAPPSNADGFLSVAAIGRNSNHSGFEVASFSNTGANVAAPGVDVVSAWPGGGLRSLNGTSMATPHVAGVAALWAQKALQQTGRIHAGDLMGKLVGNASIPTGLLAADVGTGLVVAP
ncbi:S8 family peptidase [Rhodopirellula islandica]|nr:S8 family serine peptidase [Rhodopirellula islandica]